MQMDSSYELFNKKGTFFAIFTPDGENSLFCWVHMQSSLLPLSEYCVTGTRAKFWPRACRGVKLKCSQLHGNCGSWQGDAAQSWRPAAEVRSSQALWTAILRISPLSSCLTLKRSKPHSWLIWGLWHSWCRSRLSSLVPEINQHSKNYKCLSDSLIIWVLETLTLGPDVLYKSGADLASC